MKLTRLLCSAVLLGCITTGNLYAQSYLKGSDGKNYSVRDTLYFGTMDYTKYLFVKQIDPDGNLSAVQNDLSGSKSVITDIPPYSQELYENMALFEKPEQPEIVFAENETGKFCIHLNPALIYGNIASAYKQSSVEGYQELTPDVLFVFCLKVYDKPINETLIKTYASICDPDAYQEATLDPFAMDELCSTYKDKLEKAVAAVDFNQVYRLKCISEAGDYDMANESLAVQEFSPMTLDEKQVNELNKLKYCLWGNCAFHFTNTKDFLTINSPKVLAKSMYNLKKNRKQNHEDFIPITSYVYVRIQNKHTSLPQTRIVVPKLNNTFDFEISTLDKEFGKRSLLLEITHVDCYYDVMNIPTENEVTYNYVGSK